jgi:hypothetical protein
MARKPSPRARRVAKPTHTHLVDDLNRQVTAFTEHEPDDRDDALWKTRRVARFLDVSPETVLRYYRQGRLRGHRLAGQRNVLRFRRQDVLSFIDAARALDQ